jgi:hypothetical protein
MKKTLENQIWDKVSDILDGGFRHNIIWPYNQDRLRSEVRELLDEVVCHTVSESIGIGITNEVESRI